MGYRNSLGCPSSLIDHTIDESYKNVLAVAEKLEQVNSVSGHLTQIDRLYTSVTKLDELHTNMDGLLNAASIIESGGTEYVRINQLSTVATTGSYADLAGKPVLGSAASADTSSFATAEEGELATTAVQPGDSTTVPPGGTTGQFLKKLSDADGNTGWAAVNSTTLGLGSASFLNEADVVKAVPVSTGDLNGVVTSGLYESFGNANEPMGGAWLVLVEATDSGRVQQTATLVSSGTPATIGAVGGQYIRIRPSSVSAWETWKQVLTTVQQADARYATLDQVEAAATGLTVEITWADILANPGTRDGQPGRVTGPDAGTHTDPVTTAVVANEGEFRWDAIAAGWQRTGDLKSVESLETEIAALGISKEDRVSGLMPVAGSDRFPILDIEGEPLFSFKDKWVEIVEALIAGGNLGIAARALEDGEIAFTDYEGNIALMILKNAMVAMNGAQFGDFEIVWNPDLDAAVAVTDLTGDAALVIDYDGSVSFAGTNYDPIDSNAQSINYVFAEPWTDPSKDAIITWESNSEDQKALEYRVDGSNVWMATSSHRTRLFPALSNVWLHTAFLPNLTPNTKYHLRWPGATKAETFMTTSHSNVLVAFPGDYQQYDFGIGSQLADFGAQFEAEGVELLCLVGDYVNDDGEINETEAGRWRGFLGGLSNYYRRDGALIPMTFSMGNHEGRNAAGTQSAITGGDGIIGMINDICSFGYDPENPQYVRRSNGKLTIGNELLILMLETDHTVPLPSQLDWFKETLAVDYEKYRNIIVVGHTPAFCGMGLYDFGHFDTQARYLRNFYWPAMAPYADKIRFYVGGHEHIFAVTDKLQFDYDPALTLQQNDTRWYKDPVNGIRQIGNGPWGAGRLDVDVNRAGEVSTVDGSAKMIAAMGVNLTTQEVQVFGTGVTNAWAETWNVWLARFSADVPEIRNIGRDGRQFYQI